MSKKVSLPVMPLAYTGVLYILGVLMITLRRYFVPAALSGSPAATVNLVESFLVFVSAFLIIWALTSLVLNPDIDDTNVKNLLIFFGIIIIISVFVTSFDLILTVK